MGSVWSRSGGQLSKDNDYLKFEKLQLEREIIAHDLLQQRRMAMEVARHRELLNWVAPGTILYTLVSILHVRKNPVDRVLIVPCIPLYLWAVFEWHWAYGGKPLHIREETERILANDRSKLITYSNLGIDGLPSFAEIEKRRLDLESERRFQPNDVFL